VIKLAQRRATVTRVRQDKLTPPKTRLCEFSSAAALKLVYVRVITPLLSRVTLLLTVAPPLSIVSLPPFQANRRTVDAAPPKVECVET
jgi:hypothetical protein